MTDIRVIDVEYLGTPQVIGAWVIDDTILVDPGPGTSVSRLLGQLGEWRPRAIALTHIHLDHAGATGALLERWPETQVWVHESGAPHLVDPARLLRSARRVYGAALERLWGTMQPVPKEAIRAVRDGQRRGPLEVIHTPGHASHHVCFLHRATGAAFVGDVAGVRIPPSSAVLVPAVAPEFDPLGWTQSLERVYAWRPTALGLTHFGCHHDVDRHLAAVRRGLRDLVATRGSPDSVAQHVAAKLAGEGEDMVAAYEQAGQPHIFPAAVKRYLSMHAAGAR